MKGFWTVLMLVFSNVFMTFAWYGHLKLQEMKISNGWPLILIILFSWGIAFFEYCLTVPANRIGFIENGGPFNLIQLKVIQEVISLTIFSLIVTFLFRGQAIQWNHIVAFICLVLAVFFVFFCGIKQKTYLKIWIFHFFVVPLHRNSKNCAYKLP